MQLSLRMQLATRIGLQAAVNQISVRIEEMSGNARGAVADVAETMTKAIAASDLHCESVASILSVSS